MPGHIVRFSRFSFLRLALLCLVATDAVRAQDTAVLPQAQVGKAYSISIGEDTENGKGQLTWKLAHGDLPPGLQVSAVGKIEGTPTDAKSDPYVFDLNVSDSSQPPQSALLCFSVTVLSAPFALRPSTWRQRSSRFLGSTR